MISFEEAIKTVKENVSNLKKIIKIDLLKTLENDYTISEDIISPINYPKYNRSMMDGYTIMTPKKSLEKGTVLDLMRDVSHAGFSPKFKMEENKLCTISTGAILPENADLVIKIEDTELIEANKVKVNINLQSGDKGRWKFVRKIGSDIKVGDVIAKKGEKLTTSLVCLLAQLGVKEVNVYDRDIKIGVFSTGDEIIDPEKFDPENDSGKICDVNRMIVIMELRKKGLKVLDLGIIRDAKEEVKEKIEAALKKVDILITTGAVSMGERDFIKPVLRSLGKVHFEKIAIKPGKPVNFCTVEKGEKYEKKKIIFGLPGNPVSAFFGLTFFCLPALTELIGEKHSMTKIKVKIVEEVKALPDREHFVRAKIFWNKDHFIGFSTGNQNSSRIQSLKDANGFLRIQKGEGKLSKNTMVDAILVGQIFVFDEEAKKLKKQLRSKPIRACGCDHSEDEEEEEEENSKKPKKKKRTYKIGVLTISTRASLGKYEDISGKVIKEFFVQYSKKSKKSDWVITKQEIVPDDVEKIEKILLSWCESNECDFILTTGGTGFTKDDLTPEATKRVITFEAQNIINGIQSLILPKVPMAMLSRAISGVRICKDDRRVFILNLPGKPKACTENLEILMKANFGHVLQLLNKTMSENV